MAGRKGRSKKTVQERQISPNPETPRAILPVKVSSRFTASNLLLLGCALVAAYLMYTNLSYGLPFYYHTDEHIKAISAVELARGRAPMRFNHPQFMLFFTVPFIL